MITIGETDSSNFLNSIDYQEMQLAMGYRPKMDRHLDPKVAFDIGWDYYVFGMKLPKFLATCKDLSDGFYAAKDKFVTKKPHSDNIRKWLLLRSNAWKRNRIFNETVTPEFLEDIASDMCPVTKVLLTRTTGTETDWSVDRVNNEGSYCPCNLIIVSSRANKLKNNFSYEEIMKFAYDETCELPENLYGLTPLTRIEWSRWALICSLAPNSIDEDSGRFVQHEVIAPCIIIPPSGFMESIAAYLQIAVSGMASGRGRCFKDMTSVMPKAHRTAMRNLVKRAKKVYSSGNYTPMQIWYNNRLFKEMLALYMDLSTESKEAMRALIIKNGDSTQVFGDLDIGLESKGYVNTESEDELSKMMAILKARAIENKTSLDDEIRAEIASIDNELPAPFNNQYQNLAPLYALPSGETK